MSSRRRARLDRARRLARARRPADRREEQRWMRIWKELPPHVAANVGALMLMRCQADPGDPPSLSFNPEDPLDEKIADIARSLWVTVDDLTRVRRWSFDGGVVREVEGDG